MSILPAQMIRDRAGMIEPFMERHVVGGLSAGLASAGYDVSAGESFFLFPFERKLTFTLERIVMPNDLVAEVVTKSTWARRFVTMPNTRLEPGWRGHITIELINHLPSVWLIKKGSPIGCVEFKTLLRPTEQPYGEGGKYQDQPARAVAAKFEAGA